MADADGTRIAQPQGGELEKWRRLIDRCEDVADPDDSIGESAWFNPRVGRVQQYRSPGGPGISAWLPEPGVGRVANGIPNRMDRLSQLGNAVVPQLAEAIGRLIIAADETDKTTTR